MPDDITRALVRKGARENAEIRKRTHERMLEDIALAKHQAQEAVGKALGTYERPNYH